MIDHIAHMRDAFGVLKRNYTLALPTAIAGFIVAFISIPILRNPEDIKGMALLLVVGLVISFFSQGVTLAMAFEAVHTGSTSLGAGGGHALRLFNPLLGASVWMTLIISSGFLLFIAPGLIAYFLLLYSLPSIVIDGAGPFEAMKRSLRVIRANLRDTLMLFMWVMSVGLVLGGLNILLGSIPVAGQLFGVVISGAFGGFISVVLVTSYIELTAASKTDSGDISPVA